MADDGLSEKDIKQIKKELDQIKQFIKAIEKMGGEVPAPLKKALNRLEIAINTGKDIGDAASDASDALRTYENDLENVCKTIIDEEQKIVCEYGKSRAWQARGVKWTLSPKQKDGVISKSIMKTVKRYTPEKICKHWDYCAKIDKAAK